MSEFCPVCDRELGDENVDRHHLIPKVKGGKEQFHIHQVCHRKIHSLFSEWELKHYFNTWEAIRSHEDMQKFIKWVQKKPINFNDTFKEANRRK